MSHSFKQTNLDTFVAALTNAERWQIILDYDTLSREAKIGDSALRSQTEAFLESEGRNDDTSSFVLHMIELGNACHKYRSIHQDAAAPGTVNDPLGVISKMRDVLKGLHDPQRDSIWCEVDEAIEMADELLAADTKASELRDMADAPQDDTPIVLYFVDKLPCTSATTALEKYCGLAGVGRCHRAEREPARAVWSVDTITDTNFRGSCFKGWAPLEIAPTGAPHGA